MDWVKLYTTYSDDVAISTADDAGEVMFTRGLAYCGRARTGGFIPDGKLQDLTRRPARAKTIVQQLTRDTPLGEPGPWEVVAGGYRIRNWSHYQEQLDALAERRKSDRVRKRNQRARDASVSRDSHVTVTPESHPQSKRESKTAAAAAAGHDAAADLPTSLAILQTKLKANTALRALRFDGLTTEKTAALEKLIAVHGDQVLVDIALRTCRTPPPVHVAAFIGTWEALPEPGQRLRLVDEDRCAVDIAHAGERASSCRYCAADRLAGDA